MYNGCPEEYEKCFKQWIDRLKSEFRSRMNTLNDRGEKWVERLINVGGNSRHYIWNIYRKYVIKRKIFVAFFLLTVSTNLNCVCTNQYI